VIAATPIAEHGLGQSKTLFSFRPVPALLPDAIGYG